MPRIRRGLRPRPVWLPALSLLLFASIPSLSGCEGTKEEVVFGLAAPLERVYGESTKLAAELAVREINEANGIDGRPLRLLVRDDETDRDVAIRVADELIASEVVAVVGHVNSSTMKAAGERYEAEGLPALATSATDPAISSLGRYIFRVAASDSANAAEMARVARERAEGIGIIYLNDDYGRGLARSFRNELTAAGVQVAAIDPYLEDQTDFTPYLRRMRDSGVDLVFFAGLEKGAALAIDQARAMGYETRFMGGDGIEALVGMGEMYDGTLVGVLFHPEASERGQEFARKFREAYQRDPDSSAALAYDAVYLLAEAARKGGVDRESIRRYLESVGAEGGAPAFEGVTGTVRFDENGDPKKKDFSVAMIAGGAMKIFRGEQ